MPSVAEKVKADYKVVGKTRYGHQIWELPPAMRSIISGGRRYYHPFPYIIYIATRQNPFWFFATESVSRKRFDRTRDPVKLYLPWYGTTYGSGQVCAVYGNNPEHASRIFWNSNFPARMYYRMTTTTTPKEILNRRGAFSFLGWLEDQTPQDVLNFSWPGALTTYGNMRTSH